MLGSGIYFAKDPSVSAKVKKKTIKQMNNETKQLFYNKKYAGPSTHSGNRFMLVCEVALGESKEVFLIFFIFIFIFIFKYQ